MLKMRHLTVAAAMAMLAWTAPSPAWTAPDWPVPVPLRGAAPIGSDTEIKLDTDIGAATSPAGPGTMAEASRNGRCNASAYEPDARGTPTMARPPTAAVNNHNKKAASTNPEIEPGSRQPSHEGSFAAMTNNHYSNATPTAGPYRTTGSRLGDQLGKEAPGLARRT